MISAATAKALFSGASVVVIRKARGVSVDPAPGTVVYAGSDVARAGPSVDFAHGPLRVSTNGRFLEHQDGTPFFYLADTGWLLFHRLTNAEAETYLENRRQKGINVIQAMLIPHYLASEPNVYGEQPFVGGDINTPNEAYFQNVDYIVDLADVKGIYIAMVPLWSRSQVMIDLSVDNTEAYNYGVFVGDRYKNRPNIIWVNGGDDSTLTSADITRYRNLANGLEAGAGVNKFLMTFHPGATPSYVDFHNDTWLDFNMSQSGHNSKDKDNYTFVTTGYNKTPAKPMFDGESRYENHAVNWNPANGYFDAFDVRQAAYWNVFAGGLGNTYGNHAVWMFDRPGLTPISHDPLVRYWYNVLDQEGAKDMAHLRKLIESRPFLTRVPDQTLVTSALSGANHIQAARGADYAFIYSPMGSSFTVNMGKISGAEVKAYWFNPRSGSLTYIDRYTNTGTLAFDPPGAVARGNDSVLVLDDASKTFPLPQWPGTPVDPEPGAIVYAGSDAARTGPSVDFAHGALKVSTNGRFLEHQDGTPFFYLADTAWNLILYSTIEEVETYLEDRRAKGFNAIQTVIVAPFANFLGGDIPNQPNRYGETVFTGNNPATPNPAYFDYVDDVIELAATKGIVIALVPSWGEYVTSGFFNATTAASFGTYVGNRYKDYLNVIFVLGGDEEPPVSPIAVHRAMANGVEAGDAGLRLKTFHPETSSSNFFHSEAWLDFNMIQGSNSALDIANYNTITTGYNRTPAKPIFDGEIHYENRAVGWNPANGYFNSYDVRQSAYWSVFAGGFGFTYGNGAIIMWERPGGEGTGNFITLVHYWYAVLDQEGAKDMKHLRKLMESRPFLTRVPDQTLVTSVLSGANHIQATRGADYAMIYSATGSSFTVNMGKISGSEVKAYWFDPRTGSLTYIDRYANTGTRAFDPPGAVARGNDYVLLLDDASKTFALPKW